MPLVPELYVSNLSQSLAFYVDLLGFRIDYQRPEEVYSFSKSEMKFCKSIVQSNVCTDKGSPVLGPIRED